MLIVSYGRVSALSQERGTSLDTQLAGCRRLMESVGYHGVPVDELRERGSGADADRPVFLEMCRRISDGVYNAVFVYSPDRLARDPLVLMMFIDRCEEAGVPLHFVEGPSGTSPEVRLLQYFFGYMAQNERRQIAERTMRGKIATARAGRMPTGTSLYGYDYDKVTKKRVINYAEAVVVKRIFDWYAAGHGVRRIVSDLIQEGMATKRNGQWTVQRVLQMLRNESYAGVDYYGRTHRWSVRGRKGKLIPRAREEWIRVEGFTPPIIATQLFEDVRQRLLMAKKRRPSHPTPVSPDPVPVVLQMWRPGARGLPGWAASTLSMRRAPRRRGTARPLRPARHRRRRAGGSRLGPTGRGHHPPRRSCQRPAAPIWKPEAWTRVEKCRA